MLRLQYGMQRGWLPLVLCLSFIQPFANSQDSGPTSVRATTSPVTPEGATETIDISSALSVAASVAPTLALGNFSNPIPLPTDAPSYNEISQLAAVFPPLVQFTGEPDIEDITEVVANVSSQVEKRQGVIRVMAAWDGLHPNELGEYQIARAFSRALVSGLDIGNTALAVPANIPARMLPVPGNLQMGPSPQGLTATWDKVFGAYGYDVDYIINGGAPFNFSPGATSTNRWDTRWALDGWTYQIRVRASSGNRKSDWTEWVSGVAKPQTASSPNNVVSRATSTGLAVTWSPPTGAYAESVFLYNVYYWDLDLPCSFLLSAAFLGSTATINGLTPGHRYLVAIEAWNSAGAGFPFVARRIIVGGGVPGPPQNLQILARDSTTAHLTWDVVPGASGYLIFSRNINIAGSVLTYAGQSPAISCIDWFFLVPGTWNYAWAISAFNGEEESSLSVPVTAPYPISGSTVPPCPEEPLAVTCSGAGGVPPATDPIDPSDPGPPEGTPAPVPNPVCISTACQTCSGSSCQGCIGNCEGCSGSGCSGCTGPECNSCRGQGCIGCSSSDCTSCTGRDCGQNSGGSVRCDGLQCTICVGLGCTFCNGPFCTTCVGSDCTGDHQSCSGPDCHLCSGRNCENCEGPDCHTCSGSDCDDTTNSCNGHDCSFCEGSDCSGCNSPFCETCFGLNCLGCLGPICTICRGRGCNGGDNSCSGVDCPTILPPPDGPPPGEDTPGDPTTATGSSSCANPTTVTRCAVSCTASPVGVSLTTMCTTVSCVPTTGCTITATTKTSTTTIGCPSVPEYTPWYTAGDQQVIINDLGAGTIIAMGTYTERALTWPTEEPSPPPPSTTAAPTPTAIPTGDPDGVPAYDVVVRSIFDGSGGNGINQLLGYKADLTTGVYDCGDKSEWNALGDNEEAADGLPPTITDMTVFGDSSCRYDETRDYEATPDDGMAFVGYIMCDEWKRMFCYKNVTLIGGCGQLIGMRQRLRCAWLAYHGGA